MKKLFSLVLVVIMTMALAVPASAAEPKKGTITVTNATADEDYAIYKVFDMDYDELSSGEVVYTYTLDSYLKDENGEYKRDGSNKKILNPFVPYVTAQDSPFEVEAGAAGGSHDGIYLVDVKNGGDVVGWMQEMNEAIDANPSEFAACKILPTITDGDLRQWYNVPCGYYLVNSSLGATVTVDTVANPQENSHVEVIDKNQVPFIPEQPEPLVKVSNNGFDPDERPEDLSNAKSVQYGDVVTYTVGFPVTMYSGDEPVSRYVLHDALPDGMTLTSVDSVVVAPEKDEAGYTLTKDVEFTVDTEACNLDDADFGENCTFEINIPWMSENGDEMIAGPAGSVIRSENYITVTYSAIVNEGADVDTPLVNAAKFSWNTWDKENPGQESFGGSSNTDKWAVETYALAILKVNEEGDPLANAVFELTCDEEPIYVKDDPSTDEAGVYILDTAVDGEKSNEIITPRSGIILIKGLRNDTYTITETRAPEGYNLQASSIDIEATQAVHRIVGEVTNKITVSYDENGEVIAVVKDESKVVSEEKIDIPGGVEAYAKVVVNYPSNKLIPDTGGSGTTAYYAVGGVLMAAAAVLLVVKKAKKKEQ